MLPTLANDFNLFSKYGGLIRCRFYAQKTHPGLYLQIETAVWYISAIPVYPDHLTPKDLERLKKCSQR